MENITDIHELESLKTNGALFILFGGPTCGVCQSLRPRLEAMLEQRFSDMQGVYVDCQVSPEICAQHGVFSLPVVKVYLIGRIRPFIVVFGLIYSVLNGVVRVLPVKMILVKG